MINLSKIFTIFKENNLFSKNEFILMSSTILFIFVAWMFSWNIGFVNDFREMAYIASVGLAYLLISNIVAAYFAISSISKDLDGKYVYFILKSANRFEYILGKALSVLYVVLKTNIFLTIAFLFFYKVAVWKIDYSILFVPAFQVLESFLIGIVALLVAFLIKNNIARIFFIITIHLIGHVTYPIKVMIDNGAITFGKLWNFIYDIFYKVFPNLDSFNVRDVLPYNTDLYGQLFSSIGYASIWILVILVATYYIFRKENL